jgi:LacI family transcriptional regulator
MLVDKCIDGIIIAPCGQGKEHLEEVVERNIPMVYITRSNPYITADSVLFESINGSFNIVQYLIQKGHKRIGMLCRTIDLENPKERLEGYKRALEENRLFVDPELIVCEKTGVGGQSYGMEKLMHLSHPPTAVYASINAQAQGAFRYCRAHGLFIPEDVELACFESFPDEDPIRNRPRWVANELPFAQLGAIATRLLFERVMQKVKTPPRHIVLEGKMRIPESAESG